MPSTHLTIKHARRDVSSMLGDYRTGNLWYRRRQLGCRCGWTTCTATIAPQ